MKGRTRFPGTAFFMRGQKDRGRHHVAASQLACLKLLHHFCRFSKWKSRSDSMERLGSPIPKSIVRCIEVVAISQR